MTIFLSSCSSTRRVPDGAYLYTGAKIEIETASKTTPTSALDYELSEALYPQPNRRLFGIPWRLRWYSFFYTKKEKGFFYWLAKTLGEPPIIYDEANTQNVAKLLENKATNNGYFNTEVSHQTIKKKKKAKVIYQVKVEEPYRIKSLNYHIEHPELKPHIDSLFSESLLKIGDRYQLDVLKKERSRIERALKEKGYYFFDADYLKFQADSTEGQRQIKVNMQLKEGIAAENLRAYQIGNIQIFPDYATDNSNNIAEADSLYYEGLSIIHKEPLNLKPETWRYAIIQEQNKQYRFSEHNTTIKRLSNLGIYKFISVRFLADENVDSLLSMKVLLTPRVKHKIEGTFGLASRSLIFIGPEFSTTYTNRNTFKEAELLKITGNGNFNTLTFTQDSSFLFPIPYYQQWGINVNLSKPGLIVPFRKRAFSNRLIAKTKLNIGYSSQRVRMLVSAFRDTLASLDQASLVEEIDKNPDAQPALQLSEFSFTYGFNWFTDIRYQHELNPLKIRVQNGGYETSLLQDILSITFKNSRQEDLLLRLERAFILQPDYIFRYDSRLVELTTHNYFWQSRTAFAGILFLIDKNSPLESDNRFNQYIQLENDFRYFYIASRKNTIATRLKINYTIPFQDELVIPYTDLYTIGGVSGVRAFAPRTVGPGTTDVSTDATVLQNGYGEIQIESSLEYRFKANDFVETAFFVDAGNIWLNEGSTSTPEGVFQLNSFYKELAIGGGIGFRLDFDYLVIRLDFATPFYKPWLAEGERFVLNRTGFSQYNWARDNLNINFAFGYPF